ncbi:hypothetical protein ES703_50705 [subsurface metagenome]
MQIGTLIIETSGLLIEKDSAEKFISAMDSILKSTSEKYEVDWRRFEFWAASTYFSIPIDALWRNDAIYKGLKRTLIKNFTKWSFWITLLIYEQGE